jgi:hypothetical protein
MARRGPPRAHPPRKASNLSKAGSFGEPTAPGVPSVKPTILSRDLSEDFDMHRDSDMATPTSRRAPAADALIEERDALCAELIALEREGAPRVTRAAAIEARLKKIADERGESFKVTLANGDYVRVSPPVAAEFKGNVPVVQTEAWQALKPAEQKAHVKGGLIKVEAHWGRASSGRVDVKVF